MQNFSQKIQKIHITLKIRNLQNIKTHNTLNLRS